MLALMPYIIPVLEERLAWAKEGSKTPKEHSEEVGAGAEVWASVGSHGTRPWKGPQGATVWMAIHFLLVLCAARSCQ